MAGLMDMYLQQIAQSRVNLPQVGQRPINSGIVTGEVNPGYGDIGTEIGKGLGSYITKAYTEPRAEATANAYTMANDPKVSYQRMQAAYTLYNKMPDDLRMQVQSSPGHQQQLQKWAQQFPDAPIVQGPSGLMFSPQARTLDEQKALSYPQEAQAEIGLKTAQAGEQQARTGYLQSEQGLTEAKTKEIPSTAEAERSEKYATATEKLALAGYYNNYEAIHKSIDSARVVLEDKRADVREKLQAEKLLAEAQKKILEAHNAGKKIEENANSSVYGSKPPTAVKIENALRNANSTQEVIDAYGPQHNVSRAEAKSAVTKITDTIKEVLKSDNRVGSSLGVRGNRSFKDYPEEQKQSLMALRSKAVELASKMGVEIDEATGKKVIWILKISNPTVSAEELSKYPDWTSVSTAELLKYYGGK